MAEEEHVWLSSMGVWAKKPRLPPGAATSSVSAEQQEEDVDSYSAKHVQEEEDEDDEGSRTSCPVCLLPLHGSNLAVLRWCMHRFCLDCIQKWSSMKRVCPLCKQIFHGWYHSLRSPSEFRERVLVPPPERVSARFRKRYRRTERPSTPFQRSKPLQWRRSFSSFKAPREAELEWRASIYRKGLKAVPPVLKRTTVKQVPAPDPGRKSRIEKRLEPWIRREFQAITPDSDPTVLVQFVLSLWFIALEQTERIKEGCESSRNFCQQPSRHLGGVNQVGDTEAVHQLKPFLHEKAATFWHELKCFAESPYSMKAYDSTTAYKKE